MGKLIIVLSFIFLSCSDYSEYERRPDGKIYIQVKDTFLDRVEIVDWRVGPKKKQKVSKGVRFSINFPQFDDDDLEDLVSHKKIDSWLIRVHKNDVLGSRIIGHLYIPIVIPGNASDSPFRIRQTKKGFINVFYTAAARSKRFENFHCPAFNHSKIVTDVELLGSKSSLDPLVVSSVQLDKIRVRVEEFGYGSTVVDGGMDIRARYGVDISLYNSKDQLKFSSFLELPQVIDIQGEQATLLSGCENFKIPPPGKDGTNSSMKKFRFGR